MCKLLILLLGMLGVGTKSRFSINNTGTGLQGDYHLSLRVVVLAPLRYNNSLIGERTLAGMNYKFFLLCRHGGK